MVGDEDLWQGFGGLRWITVGDEDLRLGRVFRWGGDFATVVRQLLQFYGLAEDGVEGIGELAGGGVGEGLSVELVEDGFGAVDHFEVEFGEAVVDALVLQLAKFGLEFIFDAGPAFEGIDADIEFGADFLDVAVVLVE